MLHIAVHKVTVTFQLTVAESLDACLVNNKSGITSLIIYVIKIGNKGNGRVQCV